MRADEPLVELETDKVTLEVPAPAAGVISAIAVKDGATVNVGAVLGAIEAQRRGARGPRYPGAHRLPRREDRNHPADRLGLGRHQAARGGSGRAAAPAPRRRRRARAWPRPASTAATSTGTGKDGRITKADALSAVGELAAPPATPQPAPQVARAPAPEEDVKREKRVPMTRLRQTIARRLKEAQDTAAMLTTFNEVDMTNVMALRSQYRDLFEKKHGIKLGFMGFFVKACVQALKEIPAVNGEIDGTDIVYKDYYHVGIAVGTDKGLIVPVVRDAETKSLAEIEKTIADLGKRARDGQLAIDELQGGTFTITNGGIYGSLMSTPILNAPQSGILGMHKIQERPMVVAGKVEVGR